MTRATKTLLIAAGISVLLASFGASTQTCTPAPPGVIAWWPFDELSGTTAEDVVGGDTGTHSGGPISTMTAV